MHLLHEFAVPVIRRPLLCIALAWVGGLLLSARVLLPWHAWVVVTLLLLGAWAVAMATMTARVALLLAVITLGAAYYAWRTPLPAPGDARYLPSGGVVIVGYPLSIPAIESGEWRVTMRLLHRRAGAVWLPAAGDVYLLGYGIPPQTGRYYQITGRVREPEEPGNPFGFSWRAYLVEHGLTYAISTVRLSPLPGQAPVSPLPQWRAWLRARLRATMPSPYADLRTQLLEGVVLGIHGVPLPIQITDQFRRAGTIHLMVVSGSQVALLGQLLLMPLLLLPRGRAGASYPRLRIVFVLISLPLLAAYLALADRGPSVDRAVLMILSSLLAIFLTASPAARRRAFTPDSLTTLAIAVILLLLCNPALLFSPGLQLSFAGVFGLLAISPVLMRVLEPRLGHWALIPAGTLGAQMMTIPVLAWHFGAVPLLAPLTNLIAMPVVGLLVPSGLLAFLLAALAPTVAYWLNIANAFAVQILLGVSALAAGLPWAEWRWVMRNPLIVLLYYVLLAFALHWLSRFIDRTSTESPIPAGREPRLW